MNRALLFSLLVATAPIAAAAQTVVIQNAKIETAGPRGEIAVGTVVIKDGKIAAIGPTVAPPAGARMIDAKGQVLTPGFVAASTSLGVEEVEGVAATHDESAGPEIGAAFDISYGVNPQSTLIPIAREAGVTRAVVTPVAGRGGGGDRDDDVDVQSLTAGGAAPKSAGASLFDGQAALIETASGLSDTVLKSRVAMVVDFGENGARRAGSRGAEVVLLKAAFEDARRYRKNKAVFDKGGEIPSALTREDLEALIPVVEGKTPLLVRAHRAADIRLILKLAKDEHLELILEGCEEGWIVAPEIAAAGVPVLIDTEADLPESFETLGARLDNAARLQAAGVLLAIEGSRDFNNVRQARFNAGTAVANGLSWPAALAAVTINPAKIWGFADRAGSIEVGKDADLVLWSGDPFETSSYPVAVFVAGQEQPQNARILQLRDRYAKPPGPYPRQYD
jgi:imidazolonepropionase-like amidohydrolase